MIAAAIAASAALPASAQWKINEVLVDTSGNPNHQYVELHNPTAAQSVAGLSIIGIDTLGPDATAATADDHTYDARIDLVGTASGNYFLVANDAYTSAPGRPAADQSLGVGGVFIADTYEIILVNTANISGSWTLGTTRFAAGDFAGGAQVLDGVVLLANATDNSRWTNPKVGPDGGFNPTGAERSVDGAGTWQILTFNGASTGALPLDATPKGNNTAAASVGEWQMY
jgi:hypothetical protein